MNIGPTFGDAVLRIAPGDILVPPRLGLYFPDKAAALGRLMAVGGQRTPITVRRSGPNAALPWTLVVGMHRLQGAMIEALPEVMALERIGSNGADHNDLESSENVHRREQPPLERAIFVHATCEAAKARLALEHGDLSQQQIAIKSRWARVKSGAVRAEQVLQEESDDTADNLSAVYGWQDSAAEAFGLGKRDIRRALTLYRLVIEPFPKLTQALSDHPVVGNNASELKRIAEVRDEGQRRQVIDALLADPELGADAARVLVGIDDAGSGTKPTPEAKFTNAISGSWSRLSLTAKREFLPQFVTLLTPGLRQQLRALIDATEREEDETFADAPLNLPSMLNAQR